MAGNGGKDGGTETLGIIGLKKEKALEVVGMLQRQVLRRREGGPAPKKQKKSQFKRPKRSSNRNQRELLKSGELAVSHAPGIA